MTIFTLWAGKRARFPSERFPVILRLSIVVLGTSLLLAHSGCVTSPGARSSIWPTKSVNDPTSIGGSASGASSITSKLGSTARGVKGQFSSMGTAVTSAYGKAKTAVSSAFVPAANTSTTGEPSDQTSLANTPSTNTALGPEIHVITGQMYEAKGQYAKALDCYSKALETEATNVAALSSMARLHDRQNNTDKAIEFYQRAIKVAPNQAALYADHGSVYARVGQIATAKEQYQKAINLDPKNRSYRSSLAGLLVDEGQADKAEQELQQVDGPAMANYQMAYLYMSRQNIPETRQYLTKALAIDPNLQPARDMMNSLGGPQLAQQAGGMLQQANQVYQQVGQLGSAVQNAYSPNNIATVPASTNVAPATSIR
jgi:Tfp pilus assembly protein PilF